MARFADPFTQYQNNEGNLLSGGKLVFYIAGTVGEFLQTFQDNEEQVPHPLDGVLLDASGRVPPIFYKGSARVELLDSTGQLVEERDNVGGENVFGDFADYNSQIVYDLNDKVLFTNNKFYISLQNNNIGNDPSLSPGDNEFWSEIRFTEIHNMKKTYAAGYIVQDVSGNLWRSVQADNVGNVPTNSNDTWWTPTYDITNAKKYATVFGKSAGATLTPGVCNLLLDGSTFPLPPANSVNSDSWLDIYQSDVLAPANQPIVERSGADLIQDSGGTDTGVQFDVGIVTAIRLVSNGVDRWKL